jgi:hypothetical protein
MALPPIPSITGGPAVSSASSGGSPVYITTGGSLGGKGSSLLLWGLGALAAWYILKK